MKTYQTIATSIQAKENCADNSNNEWFDKWDDRIESIMKTVPSGSGFDAGTTIHLSSMVFDKFNHTDRLCFSTSFHHMNENGFYDGWTEHIITIRPDWNDFDIKISGRNKNDIKDYICEIFSDWLSSECQVAL